MKKIIAALVVGVFLFGAALAGVSNQQDTVTVEKKNVIEKVYQFSQPEIREKDNYAIVSLEGTKSIMQEGMPILPYKVDVMRFPVGTKINVEAKEGEIKEIKLSSKIKPYPMFTLLTTQGKLVVREGSVYESDEAYPENWLDYRITVGLYNGERVATLSLFIYPCRYIPKENKIIYTDKIDVKIDYDLPTKPLFTNDEYDLLIISPDSWMADLQPLKEHKESHGIKTIIVGLNEIYGGKYFASQGRDDAEKIKYFIKDAIEEWGIKYVMLVGGRKFTKEEWIMPVRYAYSIDNVPPFTENGYLSDLYFADVYKYEDGQPVFEDWDSNGNNFFAEYGHNGEYDVVDLYPDVYVGRLPCRNKIELKTVVKKIIEYENAMGEWRKRIILCGGDTDLHDVDDINEGEYLNEKVAELMESFECIKLWTSNGMLSRKNFFKEMMKGAMFVDFSGHGSPNSWATHPHNSDEWIGITLFDILLYFNGNKLPIIFANACHTAQFNLTYECFGWSFVKKIEGGAIAFIGSTGLSYGFGGYATADSLSGYLEIEFFRNYFNSSYVCEMFYNAIISYLNNIPMDDWQDFKSVEEYVLLGMPCLEINL